MPKLIVTCRYLKSGSAKNLSNYVKYIATREGSMTVNTNNGNAPATAKQQELIASLVKEFPESKGTFEYADYEKHPTQRRATALISEILEHNADRIANRENYVEYLAKRPGAVQFGAHGLFSQEDTPIDLEAVMQEVANHSGNVWTHVVSLRRDDAQRMGYDTLTAWRELIKRQIPNIAKQSKIDLANLKWYAAFHDKETNPHVHIIIYSTDPKEGFLTNHGIEKIRSGFANDIYSDELHHLYEQQTAARDQLKKESDNAVSVNRVWLKEGYSPDDEYYYQLNAQSRIWDNANEHVVKAVVGAYDSLESAAEAEDIKDQLLPAQVSDTAHGYNANYNIDNGGIFFTVFFDDNTSFKFLVVFYEYDPKLDADYIRQYSNVPIIGEADPWFRITGANDTAGKSLDTYVVENGKNINVDTMYGYGYQAAFINEDVNSFEPVFWLGNSEMISVESIYVNGRRFNAGDTISFADGENTINALFSVIINDANGKHTKNYNVSFIKKAKGAQLYVAGPIEPEVRSVFLDEYFEYKHDIFIANVGDQPLTNLRLELDAENVALDPYWTIGGAGNDTLTPCTDNLQLELLSSNYGELSNVAKIRLIPDGENSGEIDGTLKIYSGEELLTTLYLSGRAQNPEIITSEIDDAVLYVPYSYLIATNNMYDWTDVTFSLNGSLPDGVDFYPETGEIYGVPLETGKFTFEIQADFTSDTYSFDSSIATLSLTVKDNTNYNVYTATDEDYTLLNAIGTDVGGYDFVLSEYDDTLFRSEGVLEQFVGLWLNGERLEEGVDYDAESGSTKITIYAQTFENKADKNGTNTIAAEFRTTDTNNLNTAGNTNELRRMAQNFRLDIQQQEGENDVTCSIRIFDPTGNVMSGVSLELRSTPQYAITNSSGIAQFNPIAFGSHTLYAKDASGNITAQKDFEIVSGTSYSLIGDTITAIKGSSITIDVEYDGSDLKLLSSDTFQSLNGMDSTSDEQNSNELNTNTYSNSDAKQSSTSSVPGTGDNFHFKFYFLVIITALIGVYVAFPYKKITKK